MAVDGGARDAQGLGGAADVVPAILIGLLHQQHGVVVQGLSGRRLAAQVGQLRAGRHRTVCVGQLGRQVIGLQVWCAPLGPAGQHGTGQHGAQLAEVAGPGMPGQARQRRLANSGVGVQRGQGLARGLGKVLALAQCRQCHLDHRQPVHQVIAEAPRRHLDLQVHRAGRQQLHIHPARLRAAHRPHLLVVEKAQQRRLQVQGQLAYLVEQQGAAIGTGDQADAAVAARTGEGAADMAEQFGLEQLIRQGAAVHCHEGPAPATGLVGVAGQQFLAGAGLALDQHRHAHAHGGLHGAAGGGHGRVLGKETRLELQGGRRPQHRPSCDRAGGRPAQYPRHQGTAQAVAQRQFGPWQQAAQAAREGCVEQGLEWATPQRAQAGQQVLGPAIERAQAAGVVEGQQPGRQRAQVLGTRVQGQHPALAHLVQQQVVLDVGGRHLHQRLGVLLARCVTGRSVQHADDIARRIAHR